jgi:hypothetical protein
VRLKPHGHFLSHAHQVKGTHILGLRASETRMSKQLFCRICLCLTALNSSETVNNVNGRFYYFCGILT